MRICCITGLYPTPLYPNGGVFVTRRIAALKALGTSVDAYALVVKESWIMRKLRLILRRRPNEEVQDSIPTEDPSVSYHAIKVPMNMFEFAINMLVEERYFIWKAQRFMVRSIGDKRYDVIHGHWLYPTGGAVVRYAQTVNTPCLITAHGSEVHRDMRKKYRKGCLWTLEHSTKAEFVSQALLQKAKQYGYSGKNALVSPNGIDEVIPNKTKRDGCTVGYVGNLIPIKRADQLADIFHRIQALKNDTHFVVIGDGTLRKQITEETHDLDIVFTGLIPHKQVLQEMQKMDVLILPSRNEGFGCVALEAHSCGTPVVGSNNGGIPEAIGDERLVVNESASFNADFAQRVAEVLQGKIPFDSAALINRAQQYTWNQLQQQELTIYRSLR